MIQIDDSKEKRMAEAVVAMEEDPAAAAVGALARFFCHICDVEILALAEVGQFVREWRGVVRGEGC